MLDSFSTQNQPKRVTEHHFSDSSWAFRASSPGMSWCTTKIFYQWSDHLFSNAVWSIVHFSFFPLDKPSIHTAASTSWTLPATPQNAAIIIIDIQIINAHQGNQLHGLPFQLKFKCKIIRTLEHKNSDLIYFFQIWPHSYKCKYSIICRGSVCSVKGPGFKFRPGCHWGSFISKWEGIVYCKIVDFYLAHSDHSDLWLRK